MKHQLHTGFSETEFIPMDLRYMREERQPQPLTFRDRKVSRRVRAASRPEKYND